MDSVEEGQGPEVARERCDFIYRRVAPGVAATAVLSLLLSAFLWRSRPLELIVFWQLLILALSAALWALSLAYRRTPAAREQPTLWIRRAAFAATALGAGWGFAAAVFFPGAQEEQVFISFMVAVVTVGALPLFSTVWWVYALYAAGVMLPFNIVLFAYGTELFRLLGAAVPLLYIANVLTAYELGRVFASAFGLRGAYRRLSSDNAEIQAQLGEQLDSLLDAHREVQAYGRKLSLFSERAPIAVFEVDPRATILDMNPAAENLFGYASPEMVGRNIITMLLAGDDRSRIEAWWGQFIADGKPATLVAENCMRRDGLALACEWTMTPLVSDEGQVGSIVLQGRDITQQRAAERVRSEFTSTLSHELRTPLTSILGSLSLLRSGALGDVPKEQDEIVEIAERNGRRLLDLINEVLDIEKIESGRLSLEPEPLELAELVRESLRLNQGFADRFQVRLALEGSVPPVTVRADRKRLMQVMTNLLSNAAKFSPPGGSVDVGAALTDGKVRVGVGDRGPGHPRGLSQPHLRPLRAGRLGGLAHQGRHGPRARDLQAADRDDAGPRRLRGPRRRRHHLLLRAAGHAGGRGGGERGRARADHRGGQRRRRVPRHGAREGGLPRRHRGRRRRFAHAARALEVRGMAALAPAARHRGHAGADRRDARAARGHAHHHARRPAQRPGRGARAAATRHRRLAAEERLAQPRRRGGRAGARPARAAAGHLVRRGFMETGLLVSLAQIAAVVAIGVPLVMYLVQDKLVFMPQPVSEDRRAQIKNRISSVEEIFLEAEDGAKLHAWHVKGEPLVLYFGGNAEEVSWMLEEGPRRLPGAGWLLVDYRGYGASEGSPSEKALSADALLWYDHAAKLSPEKYFSSAAAWAAAWRCTWLPRGRSPAWWRSRPTTACAAVATAPLSVPAREHAAATPLRLEGACAADQGAAALPRRRARRGDPDGALARALRSMGRREAQGRAARCPAQQHRQRAAVLADGIREFIKA